jgi:hypothetical protein
MRPTYTAARSGLASLLAYANPCDPPDWSLAMRIANTGIRSEADIYELLAACGVSSMYLKSLNSLTYTGARSRSHGVHVHQALADALNLLVCLSVATRRRQKGASQLTLGRRYGFEARTIVRRRGRLRDVLPGLPPVLAGCRASRKIQIGVFSMAPLSPEDWGPCIRLANRVGGH